LKLDKGKTQAPAPLTESDLIAKMDQNGIGTDATIHEHIKTVQERGYAMKQGIYILPCQLGVSLVSTYQRIGIDLYKPYLRAKMELDMK
jgi:DNA topoisomerase III